MFLRILGTGLRAWRLAMGSRSTGHVGCREIHCPMQERQKACSQSGDCKKRRRVMGAFEVTFSEFWD